MKTVLFMFLWVAFSFGCATSIYDWGSYEGALASMYTGGEAHNVHQDLDRLTAEVEKSVAANKLVPPGKLAHLGYLFYLAGDTASAIKHFEAESRAFPEGSKLMNHMLERLR